MSAPPRFVSHGLPPSGLLLCYVIACSAFNLLCAHSMNLHAFSISDLDLLAYIQLPGLCIGACTFLLAALSRDRHNVRSVRTFLGLVCAISGLILITFIVVTPMCCPDLGPAVVRLKYRGTQIVLSRIRPYHPNLDVTATVAFVTLDCWFGALVTLVFRKSRRTTLGQGTA